MNVDFTSSSLENDPKVNPKSPLKGGDFQWKRMEGRSVDSERYCQVTGKNSEEL